MTKITRHTKLVHLHAGLMVGRRFLIDTIRGIAASKAYQFGGRDALKPSTRETLDRALMLIGALDAARKA